MRISTPLAPRLTTRLTAWLATWTLLTAPAALAAELTIQGKVTADGKAAGGAGVRLVPIVAPYEVAELRLAGRAAPEPVAETSTGPSGFFKIVAPDAGMWAIAVDAPGHAPSEYLVQPLLETVELPTLKLQEAEKLTVEVRSPDGEPVDARVLAFRYQAEMRRFTGRRTADRGREAWSLPVFAGATGEKGRLELRVEGKGPYFLQVTVPGYLPAERDVRAVGKIEVRLEKGRDRVVRAVDGAGRPVAGAVLFEAERTLPLAVTGDDGRATVTQGVKPIRLRLLDADGRRGMTTLAVVADDESEPEEAAVTLEEPRRLAGRVLDRESRRPIGGALVWPAGASGDFSRTDGSGAYELRGTNDGNIVWGAATGYVRSMENLSRHGGRPPGAEPDSRGPTLALTPAATVGGRVVDPEGHPVADVEVVASEKVEMTPNRMFRMKTPREPRTARSNARGEFRVTGLPAGAEYTLEFRREGYAEAEHKAEKLLPFEQRIDLHVVLDRGRRGFGRVVDEADEAVVGAAVRLTPRAEKSGMAGVMMMRIGDRSEEAKPEFLADREGLFEIPDLAAGKYDLEVEASGFGLAAVPGIEVPEDLYEIDLGTVVMVPGVAIEGRVVDPDGNPLAEAEIRAGKETGMPAAFLSFTLARERPRGRSDARGEFTVGDLREGEKVHLLVTRAGYVDATASSVMAPTVEPVEIEMKKASQVYGKVVDEEERPIEGAQVRIQAEGQMMPGGRGRSRADGSFELADVAPGRVTVSAEAGGYQKSSLSGLVVPDGGDLAGVVLKLPLGAVVEGTVFAPDGRPVMDARIRAVEPGSTNRFNFGGMQMSDGDGRYWLDGLALGRRTVIAEHEVYQRVARDVEIESGVNKLDLVFEGGVDVSGVVVGPQGGPVEGARVTLSAGRTFFSLAGQPEGLSQADGTFVLNGVQPGQYTAQAAKEGFAQARTAEAVTVGQTAVSGVELQLTAGATLTGEVRGLTVDELAELRIYAVGDNDYRNLRPGEVDFEGRYKVLNLSAGEWRVTAEIGDGGRQVSGRLTVEDSDLEVTHDLEFGSGYTLTGTVFVGDRPMAGAWVFVAGKSVSANSRATTSQDGTFRLENLEEGTYTLNVISTTMRGVRHREEIEITGDDDVLIELVTARIAGWVRDSYDRTPLPGVRFRVEPVEKEEGGGAVFIGIGGNESDSRGYFSLSEVPEGSWKVIGQRTGYAPAEVVVDVQGQTVEELQVEMSPTEGLFFDVSLASGGSPAQVQAAVLRVPGGGPGDVLLGGQMETGENGRVRMTEVPPGSFELLVAAAGTATVAVTAISPGQLGRIVLPLGGSMRITVSDLAEDPITARVRLVGPSGQPFRQVGFGGRVTTETFLRSGRAEVGGLETGAWTVTVNADDGRTWTRRTQVAPGSTAHVVLE